MKEKLPFIIYIGIGAVLMAASLPHMDGYYGNMVFWVGFGTVCAESVQLLKYCWWRAPDAVDERKQMLRMRAGYLVNQLMFWILLGLDFVLALLKAPAWIILILFVLWIFQYIVGVVIYHRLEKRM